MSQFTWNLNANGDWGTAADWTPAGPPTTGATVTISTASAHTITYSSADGTSSVASLTVGSTDIFDLTGGSLTFTTSASFGSELLVQGGTLELGSLAVTAATFEQENGGTIDGTGTLTVSGATTFIGTSGNDVETGTGTTLLDGTTTDSSGAIYLDGGRVLENAGTFNWTGGTITLGTNPNGGTVGGGTIKNDAGKIFDIEFAASVYIGSGTDAFVNAGTLEQTVTTGTSDIVVPLTNTGTVSVQKGTLELSGGGTSAASGFAVASGATLSFGDGGSSDATFTIGSGTYSVVGATEIDGGGANFSGATAITSFGSALIVDNGGTLELGALSASAATLQLQNASTIDGTGTLTITGAATLDQAPTYDVETGSGTTLLKGTTTDPDGTIALDGGRTLENAGTFNLTGGAFILGDNPNGTTVGGGTIKNDAGKIFDIEYAGGDYVIEDGTGTNTFVNAGTLEQTVTTGTNDILVTLTNTGTVSVQKGTLELSGGGTSAASGFAVASGATLSFGNGLTGDGTFTMSAGTYSVAGVTEVQGGEVNFSSATAITNFGSKLLVTAGTLELGALAASAATFEQDGGTIDGTGKLTVTGAATLTDAGGNDVETSTGTTLLDGTTTDSSATVYLDSGRTLENAGTFNWAGGSFTLGTDPNGGTIGGGTIKNDAGKTFDIEFGAVIANGTGTNTFVNAGTLEQTVTTTTSEIGVTLTNTGSVSVQTGILELAAGGSSAASAITVASGATLEFGSGTFTLSAGTVAGTGLTALLGGTLELGSVAVSIGAFEQEGGTLDGTATLTVTGAATFNYNYGNDIETGAGTTLLEGMTTDSSGEVSLDGGRTLENAGTFDMNGGYILLGLKPGDTSGSATLKNDSGKTFDIQSAASIVGSTGTNTFVNAGTLEQTVTTGTSDIDVPLTNTGTVSVQTGTLELSGGGTSAASSFTVASGATLSFGDGAAGDGTFTMSAGTYSATGATEVQGGKVDFSSATAITSFGSKLLVTGLATGSTLELGALAASASSFEQDAGTIDGTGKLTITGAAILTDFDGNDIETGAGTTLLDGTTSDSSGNVYLDGGRTLENAGTFNWTGGSFTLGSNPNGGTVGGGTVQNDSGATFDAESDPYAGSLQVEKGSGTDTFVNAGTFEVTGNVAVDIFTTFTNTGTVSVQQGFLYFDGGGSSAASALTIAGSTVLDFGGGTFTLTAGSTAGSGQVVASAGTLELNAANVTFASFAEGVPATVDGTGTLTITGVADLYGGLERGSGTTLLEGATMLDAPDLFLDGGRVLENQGTITTTFSNGILLGDTPNGTTVGGGTLQNDAAGVLDIQSHFTVGNYSGTNIFTNAGTLEQTVTTGTTDVQVAFSNTGTVSVQTGTLEFDGTNTFGGTIDGSGSIVLDGPSTFANLTIGGTATVTNNATVTETAAVTIGDSTGGAQFVNASGATYDIAGDIGIATGTGAGSLFTNAGTLAKTSGAGYSYVDVNVTDTGTLSVAGGDLEFDGASNSFSGTYVGPGMVDYGGSGVSTLSTISATSGACTTNFGTVHETGVVTLADGSTITNDYGSDWDFTANAGLALATGSSSPLFTNYGTLAKTGGTGTTNVQIGFANGGSGMVSVQTGTLEFSGTTTFGGAATVSGSATARADLIVTSAVSGTGTVALAGYGTAEFGSSATGQTVNFSGTGNILQLDAASSFGGAVTGFASGDMLDLRNLAYASGATATLSGGQLQVTSNGQTVTLGSFGLASGTTATFSVSSDNASGTPGSDVIVGPAAAIVVPEETTVLAGATVSTSASSGALKGDSDPNGGTLSITSVSYGGTTDAVAAGSTSTSNATTIAGAYGTLTIGADGSYSYAATNGLGIVTAPDGAPITDTFGDTVTESEGPSAPSSLAVTVSLAAGGTETVTDPTGSATFTIGATTLTANEVNGSTYGGVIQNGSSGNVGGSLVVTGSAPLTLTGVSTYTGRTSVSGTLALSGTASIHSSTKVALTKAGATFDVSGATAGEVVNKLGGIAGTVADLGAQNLKIKVQSGTIDTFSGAIQDGGIAGGTGGSLTLGGQGELNLAGANTYTGATTLDAGTLALTGSGSIATSSGLSLQSSLGANSTFDMSSETAASIGTLSGVAGALADLGAGTLTINETTAGTFAGTIQDGGLSGGTGGSLVVAGTAALTLTGAEAYTGKTSVSGTLDLSGAASIHSSTKVALTKAGATFDISGTTTAEVVNKLGGIAGTVGDLGAQNLKIKVQTGTVDTFAGAIQDGGAAGGSGGSITLGGLGELSLTHANNTYTGGTTIDGGTLDIAALGAAGSGTITFANTQSTATLEIDAAALSGSNGAYSFANAIAGATSASQVIDLTSLAYVQGSTSATVVGGTSLVVNDGSSSMTLTLASNTSKSSFVTASDGHGGTLVYDPPAAKHAPATAKIDTRWIEMAMADFGGVGVGGDRHTHAPMHDLFGTGTVAASPDHTHAHAGDLRMV